MSTCGLGHTHPRKAVRSIIYQVPGKRDDRARLNLCRWHSVLAVLKGHRLLSPL